MTIDLTPEQREAVERRDGSLFVRAGAGSGKTRVLVERFVAAVREDGLPVERILAITFTEKAAAEMKSRVRARLLDLGEREEAREAEAAAISTIHAFCSRVLRANALAAGLDPEYVVLDEPAAARIAIDAFDLALADFLAEARAGDALDLAATYTPDRLRSMVTTVHGRLRSQGKEPALPPLDAPVESGERDRLTRAVDAAMRELGPQAGAGKTIDKALSTLERCGRSLRSLADGALADPADIAEWAVKGGATKALATPVFEELTEAHAAYLAYCAATRAAADHALLARLLALFAGHYAALKDRRSALDFDDLELRARDLLRGDDDIRGALRERYAQVMVDEFQDVNPLQAELLDLVSHGNLFAVGDEDQSIYGFRHADVQLFRDRRAAAEEAGRAVALRANFRSRPEVLAAVDATFGALWAERGFEPLVPPPGASPDEPPRVDPSVELLLVDGNRKRWEEALGEEPFGPAASKLPPWRLGEARLLAERIGEIAGPGKPYGYGDVAILMRAGSDMAVYERALVERGIPAYAHGARGWWEAQQVGDLRSYLAALANPLDELALTMVLASPLVGVSLGTIACVRLRARALHRGLWWALSDAFLPDGDGSAGLAAAIAPADRERLGAFVERFTAERARAPRLSLEALIDRAVTESGYDRVVLSMPAGDRRLANVRKLMRLARRFEADRGRDVRGFIDHLDERRLLGAREGEAPVEGESRDPAVRLMTVHAAKGLEFPVVCVADLGRSGRGDSGSGLEVSEDGRVGLRLASLSGQSRGALEWDRLKEEQNERDEEEERRIFHVAMTRAREHLILSGAVDCEKWPEPRPLGIPADWLWRALAPGAKELLTEASTGVEVREVDGLGELRVRLVLLTPANVDEALAGGRMPAAAAGAPGSPEPGPNGPLPAPEAPPPAFAGVPAPRSLPVARLSYSALEGYNRCGYRFYLERVAGLRGPERTPALARAAAAGASQLVLSLDDRPPRPAEPPGVSPLLRGTLVHELLESFDFSNPAPPPPDEVQARIEAHGAPVTPEEVERIRGLIGAFAGSPLRERVAAGRRARRELPFAFELAVAPDAPQALLVNGVVDVHVEEDDGVLVVDYKSDPLEGADPAPIVAERYATQRLVYALAVLRSGVPRATVAYCFLEAPGAPVEETFTAADAPALEARLLELAAGVLEGRFEPTDEPHRELCLTCPGRAALCKWGPDRTLRDHPAAAIPS